MKKYESYKDSGIEWIGEIPEKWDLIRLKFLSNIIPSNVDKKSKEGEQKVLLCNYVDVYKNDFIDRNIDFMEATASDLQMEKLTLQKYDVIATKDSEDPEDIGVPALVAESFENVVCGYHLTLIRSRSEILNGNYLYWLLCSSGNNQYFFTEARGITRYAIGSNVFKNLAVSLPPSNEQKNIANYLFRKSSEIDSLVSKKKNLISLLKEERTAIINKAVTKGIDPDVQYNDSGIQWIGEIPEHWEVKRLRNISKEVKTGSTPPSDEVQYFVPEEIDWFGPGDFNSLILKKAKRKISKLAITDKKCRLFPAGTILLVGIGATVGKVGISLGACSSNQQINAIILKENINPFFCMYFLSSIKEIIANEATSATLPIFNQTQTKNLVLSIPSFEEQTEIVKFIETKTSEIDTIITKTEKEIALIKEYKSVLINDVVTGKIDVRDSVVHNQDKLQETHQ